MTVRASRYLQRLQRLPHLSVADVRSALHAQDFPCFDPWLEFHERYAGYVEPLGNEQAIWGILHADGAWIRIRKVNVDKEPHEDRWYVACADVHPSHEYLLDDRGEFLGFSAQSFDIKVERDALIFALTERGGLALITEEQMRLPRIQRLIDDARQAPVVKASDKYYSYWASDFCVVIDDLEDECVRDI